MVRQRLFSLAALTSLPLVKPLPTHEATGPPEPDGTSHSWSNEAILALIGVIVAVVGILVAIRLSCMKDSKWLCGAPMSKRKAPAGGAY